MNGPTLTDSSVLADDKNRNGSGRLCTQLNIV